MSASTEHHEDWWKALLQYLPRRVIIAAALAFLTMATVAWHQGFSVGVGSYEIGPHPNTVTATLENKQAISASYRRIADSDQTKIDRLDEEVQAAQKTATDLYSEHQAASDAAGRLAAAKIQERDALIQHRDGMLEKASNALQ